MPMTYRGTDPEMRRLVQLSRNMERQLASERLHWTQQRQMLAAAPAPTKVNDACCENPSPRYEARAHAMVCLHCGLTNALGFAEFNGSGLQIEHRVDNMQERKVPYNRMKHFKKVMRDVTRAGTRVPEALMMEIKDALSNKTITRDSVRSVLRQRKLYHYYTAENYIACVLGDGVSGVTVTGAEQTTVLKEAMKYSNGFDRLRRNEKVQRRNFVNVHVLIQYIFEQCFNRDVTHLLRMPSERICKQNRKLIAAIEQEILFAPTVVTARAQLLKRAIRM